MPAWYQSLRTKTCSLRLRAFTPGLTPGVLSPISDSCRDMPLCSARAHCSHTWAKRLDVAPASRGVQNGLLNFLRHLDDHKRGRRVQIIFPTLIDDADVT